MKEEKVVLKSFVVLSASIEYHRKVIKLPHRRLLKMGTLSPLIQTINCSGQRIPTMWLLRRNAVLNAHCTWIMQNNGKSNMKI